MSRKTRKTAPKPAKTPTASSPGRVRRLLGRARPVLVVCVLLGGLAVGLAAGFDAMERYVAGVRACQAAVRYHVELQDTPKWMPATLGRLILSQVTPEGLAFDDSRLCAAVGQRAEACPWVASVRAVRRERLGAGRGVVRLEAEYRRPVARVRYDGRRRYVDGEGVVLPYGQVPKWAARVDGQVRYFVFPDAVPAGRTPLPIHYILIDGVATRPPAEGRRWDAEDLQAGLRLVKLLHTRKYVNQVTVVDVRNFRERVSPTEPELRMYAQQGQGRPTDIRFGRFPHPAGGDWVVSPDRKLRYLDEYVADHAGNLAGNHSYIDVRFDELRVSMN